MVVLRTNDTLDIKQTAVEKKSEEEFSVIATPPAPAPKTTPQLQQHDNWFPDALNALVASLEKANYKAALDRFNRNYERATSAEITRMQNVILNHASRLNDASRYGETIRLLTEYNRTYNELNAWILLANALQATKQWQPAIDALLRVNLLENDTERYQTNMKSLLAIASNYGVELKRDGNLIGVLNLYQSLYEQFPQEAQIQLKLAQAHLALGSEFEARPLLESLIYDPELGSIAQKQLLTIDEQAASTSNYENQPQAEQRQIVVPLIRAGTSMLIDARIEGSQSRLLLDTGASVTALSKARIQQLSLQPTGKSIRLSTANGITQAKLYRAKTLSIGRVNFRNLTIAEIDLPRNGSIDGLLGTDVLRQMNKEYSYLIDDQRAALIFREK